MIDKPRGSAELHENDFCSLQLGMQPHAVGPGFAEFRMTVTKGMLNGHGICHGGMVFSLADTAFAHASNSDRKVAVALGAAIEYMAPAHEGDVLTAVAKVRTEGKTTGVFDVEITNQANTLIAVFRGRSFKLKPRKKVEKNT